MSKNFLRTAAFVAPSRRVPSFSWNRRIIASSSAHTSLQKRTITAVTTAAPSDESRRVLNLSTVTKEELETIVTALGHPKYRASQIWHWIREKGVLNVEHMTNLPKKIRQQLLEYSKPTALELVQELRSTDGTIKRAYRCVDGQVIESVLMPYQDGRYTACISSQAGCAQGCVFCATGQMGFARQLSANEILEQVARFAAELQQQQDHDDDDKTHGRSKRLSNVVFMGMGEPLANYQNVAEAVNRITKDLGIGARKITVSTVGIVPNIRKLATDMPQVRLAVSLHCATDKERTKLLPANRRYGGLDELMTALQEYIEITGRRITLEWALIEGQNDDPDTARQLGNLVRKYRLRRDMVHVNVIPLNPTGGFGGSPSQRSRVDAFCSTLETEFGISCTPRVRRGIDIDAGCGQLKANVLKREQEKNGMIIMSDDKDRTVIADDSPVEGSALFPAEPLIGVHEDFGDDDDNEDVVLVSREVPKNDSFVAFDHTDAVHFESDDYEDPVYETKEERSEAARLIALVEGSTLHMGEGDAVESSRKGSKRNRKKEK